jgi:hypothetical protein
MSKKRIWKYQLDFLNHYQVIEMPRNAMILSGQIQEEILCVWAMVDPDAEKERRHFEIFMTGRDIVEEGERIFIDTFQIDEFVGHLYERIM